MKIHGMFYGIEETCRILALNGYPATVKNNSIYICLPEPTARCNSVSLFEKVREKLAEDVTEVRAFFEKENGIPCIVIRDLEKGETDQLHRWSTRARGGYSTEAVERIFKAIYFEEPVVDLSKLGLTGLPDDLSCLWHATELNLSNNALSSLINVTKLPPLLTKLNLSNNPRLSSLPRLPGRHKITIFDVKGTRIRDKDIQAFVNFQDRALFANATPTLPTLHEVGQEYEKEADIPSTSSPASNGEDPDLIAWIKVIEEGLREARKKADEGTGVFAQIKVDRRDILIPNVNHDDDLAQWIGCLDVALKQPRLRPISESGATASDDVYVTL